MGRLNQAVAQPLDNRTLALDVLWVSGALIDQEATVDDRDVDVLASPAADRRHPRRTALGALVLVVLVGGGGVAWKMQDREPLADVVDTPAPSPTETPTVADDLDVLLAMPTPPAVEDAVVQPRWDPRTAPELPIVDLGLPASLDPPPDAPELTSMPAASAMVENERGVHLVDSDGRWRRLAMPEPRLKVQLYVRTIRLGTDGTHVFYLGRTALWSRDVRTSAWRAVPYPKSFLVRRARDPELVPLSGARVLLGRGNRSWSVDVDASGFEERHRFLWATVWGGGEVFVETRQQSVLAAHVLSWGPLDGPRRSFRVDALATLSSLAADTMSVAAVRGACLGAATPGGPSRRALVALDLDDLSARAYLPVRDPVGEYTCGSQLRALTWVDEDTVLISVAALGGPERGRHTLVTWDVGTGELRRATTLPAGTTYDVAGMALWG